MTAEEARRGEAADGRECVYIGIREGWQGASPRSSRSKQDSRNSPSNSTTPNVDQRATGRSGGGDRVLNSAHMDGRCGRRLWRHQRHPFSTDPPRLPDNAIQRQDRLNWPTEVAGLKASLVLRLRRHNSTFSAPFFMQMPREIPLPASERHVPITPLLCQQQHRVLKV